MSATDDRAKRVDVGFAGGQMLALRIADPPYRSLIAALEEDRAERWLQITTEDSDVMLDLSQVVYVRLDTEQHRLGF